MKGLRRHPSTNYQKGCEKWQTQPAASTSRGTGIIIVTWTSGEDSSEVREHFKQALNNLGFIDVVQSKFGSRLYIYVNSEKLDELSPSDRERKWLGLETQVDATIKDFFPRI